MLNQNDKLILAPIRGVTNFIYRNSLETSFGGADSALAPYIVTKESGELNKRQLEDLDVSKNLLPTTAQVLTKSAKQFIHAAHAYKELGVTRINLNMGCPYPMVANRTKGSGLLLHPDKVKDLLYEIKRDCPIEFTVKIRLGRENAQELKEIIPFINELNITDFTIHARYGCQIYKGSVDIDAFEQCLPLLDTTPCYNGDIRTPNDFSIFSKRLTTVNRWMIGRGVLSNPALLAQIRGEVFNEQSYRAKLIKMHKSLCDGYMGLDNAKSDFLTRMREQWFYLKDIFDLDHKVYKKIKKVKTLEQYEQATEWIFEQELKESILN
ncbi:tRNA-dihydrouridine synthase family protein [Halobacteriovorax sp. HLS]|uniref:tRNA-dihydrouridine synthase family protein n=1 Tax=Halobacteriovorax sp. HLS TaxID=2234000 RepID=UPI000FDBFEAB|nr:tRNA-dihydrouridine synthase family protein [Halobacteriovorax sp. HLS]